MLAKRGVWVVWVWVVGIRWMGWCIWYNCTRQDEGRRTERQKNRWRVSARCNGESEQTETKEREGERERESKTEKEEKTRRSPPPFFLALVDLQSVEGWWQFHSIQWMTWPRIHSMLTRVCPIQSSPIKSNLFPRRSQPMLNPLLSFCSYRSIEYCTHISVWCSRCQCIRSV